MRTRWLASILAVLAIVLVALFWFLARRPAAKPAISIGVVRYSSSDGPRPYFLVQLGITNTGRMTIRWDVACNDHPFNENPTVRVELPEGMDHLGSHP